MRTCHSRQGKPTEPHEVTESNRSCELTFLICPQALLKPKNEAPSTEQLVDGAVSVLEQVPTAAFSLADLLKSHSAQQGRREDGAVIARLLQRLHSGDSFAETVCGQPAVSLLAPAHLLALLCDDDPGMRRAGAKTGASNCPLSWPGISLRAPQLHIMEGGSTEEGSVVRAPLVHEVQILAQQGLVRLLRSSTEASFLLWVGYLGADDSMPQIEMQI